MSDPAPDCWILSDGTAGMEAQAVGLADAMGLVPTIKSIRPSGPLRLSPRLGALPGFPPTAGGDSLAPPFPALSITCGRRHAGASIALKRQSGGTVHTIQIQDPRVPSSLFDTLVVPEHDPTRGPNVITTIGSLNRVNDSFLSSEAAKFADQATHLPRFRVAVNLGGDTQQYKVDTTMADRVVAGLLDLLNQAETGLMITTSRRTGEPLMAALAPLLGRRDTIVWTGDGPNPYFGFLGLADAIVVTADSINMVSEACSTGKPVHILPLGREPRRRAAFLDTVRAKGLARDFNGSFDSWVPEPLRETERVAALLVEQLRREGILAPNI
jgi:mitochondrial fission protein ELM1